MLVDRPGEPVNASDHPGRMYVAVRADLPTGLQMAQAMHAAFLFARDFPDQVREWMRDSQYLVVLAVRSEDELTALISAAKRQQIDHVLWSEPDMPHPARCEGTPTAAAFAPTEASRRLCSGLPLAGKPGVPGAAPG